MSGRPSDDLVRAWVVKAEHDLRNAEHTLTLQDDCPFDTVAFHAQQCVEKYLKAFLVAQGIAHPRIHDLGELAALARPALALDDELDRIAVLETYAVEARYPGEWEEIDRREAEEAVATARRIRSKIRSLLPPESLP